MLVQIQILLEKNQLAPIQNIKTKQKRKEIDLRPVLEKYTFKILRGESKCTFCVSQKYVTVVYM